MSQMAAANLAKFDQYTSWVVENVVPAVGAVHRKLIREGLADRVAITLSHQMLEHLLTGEYPGAPRMADDGLESE